MIFHVTTNFEELGGSEASLVKVLNAYEDEEVVVVSLKTVSHRIISLIENSNIEYISLNISSIGSFALGFFIFLKLLKNRDPKYIFAWMYHANFFCSLSKILSVRRFRLTWGVRHSLDDLKGEKCSIKLLIYTGRLLKFTTHKVFYCSLSALKQHVSHSYSDLNNSVYVPNGYPVKHFNFKDLDGDLVIGFAGRFHDAKDLPLFFSVCRILSDKGYAIKMKLCGRGIGWVR
jgi:glycosyltransferase involved in cell wall biosynthesis